MAAERAAQASVRVGQRDVTAMTHDEVQELLGALALGAVDDDERAAAEAHLSGCPECRRELHDLQAAAGLLAAAEREAPDVLWSQIERSLVSSSPTASKAAPTATTFGVRSRSPRRRTVNRLAIAAGMLAIAGLAAVAIRQEQTIDDLQTALRDPAQSTFAEIVDDPGARRFELVSDDGVVVAGVVAPRGYALIRTDALPPLPGGQTYQLWGQADGRLVSLGVLGPEPGVARVEAAEAFSLLAVTVEVTGGVVQSEQSPLVAGQLPA